MLGTALTEIRVTGFLEAVEELFAGVPAVTAGVAALPGAQLFARTEGAVLLTLAATCLPSVPAESRGIRPLASWGADTHFPHTLSS